MTLPFPPGSRRSLPGLAAVVLIVLGAALLPGGSAAQANSLRESGGFHTPQRLENARRNVERLEWARALRDQAVAQAAPWAALGDDELWRMVPGQDLPRAIDVTMTRTADGSRRGGCLHCGDDIHRFGNYPWKVDLLGNPWKIQCPACESIFPTNDFAAYYQSGIDERGLFSPHRADRSLLFNARHPDPDDPLHQWGVDDGFGYTAEDGLEHRFIAYYGWIKWRTLIRGTTRQDLWAESMWAPAGLAALAEAYVYTGDPMYARKAAILLDRIADVYPDMDWSRYARLGWYHSDGGSRRGKIEGRIWETVTLRTLAESYDKIIPGLAGNDDLYAFLERKAAQYPTPGPKGSRALLMENIDQRILITGADAIRDHQIRGNIGMHHAAMAACAIALNREPESTTMIDWIFSPDGGEVPVILTGKMDRDGFGDESGPSYALSWGVNLALTARMLAEYGKYERYDIYRDFPQFARSLTAPLRLHVLNFDTPSIGDYGTTGEIRQLRGNAALLASAYRQLRDPSLAVAAFRANGNRSAGLGRSIFDEDPEALAREIEAIAGESREDEFGPGSRNLAGYGFLSLETGEGAEGTAIWMYYGRTNTSHAHADRLNIGVHAFGFDLAPDLGYPEFATRWPQRMEWTKTTLAHNTVLVNEREQQGNWSGHPVFFKILPGFQAAEVESPEVYEETAEYRRTVALIETGPGRAYALDIFRVAGGNHHLRSFHGPGTTVSTEGLDLVPQPTGTLAGSEVEFGPAGLRPDRFRTGYSWLKNVERDASPSAAWRAEWALPAGYRGAEEGNGIHLRLWDFSELDQVVLADGQPPQNKPGNPPLLRYALAERSGPDLTTTFVSLLEPYRYDPLIESARRLELDGPDPHDGPVVLEIRLADGATDLLIYAPDHETVVSADGLFLDGRLGFIRHRNGSVEKAALIAGRELTLGSFQLTSPVPHHTGRVSAIAPESDPGSFRVDVSLPADGSLTGEQIIILNDRQRNAAYRIEAIEQAGDGSRISVGNISLIRGYRNERDYSQGFISNFSPGDTFLIPTHVTFP